MANKTLFALLCTLLSIGILKGQTFKIDTIQYTGYDQNMINLVVLADGYTADELPYFREDAHRFIAYFFKTEPFAQYTEYFNVFLINSISEESGATHSCTAEDCPEADHQHEHLPARFNEFPKRIRVPEASPNTIFGSSFDNYGIHRLVIPQKDKVLRDVLNSHIPNYTQVVVLVNSPFYGGSGGEFATATVNFASNDIAVHEIGHSFGKLADEYWAGNMYALEGPNRTQKAHPDEVPWKHWLGTNGVGIYAYGSKDSKAQWFRPHEFCKMQYLVAPFCSVCQEVFVETIHRKTNAILDAAPEIGSTVAADTVEMFSLNLAKPSPNTLQVKWYLNDTLIASDADSILINKGILAQGANELKAVVKDTTSLVRNPRHHADTRTAIWTIQAEKDYALSKPTSTWGDTLETCYNGFQALSVKLPDAGLTYRWYDSPESDKVVATSHNFVTARLTESKTYYVESLWKDKVSERTAITVKVLDPLPTPKKATVKQDKKNETIVLSVVKPDDKYNYVWVGEDGEYLRNWDVENERYEWRNQTSGTITVLKKDAPAKAYVYMQDKVTTCMGERLEVRLD